MSQRLRRWVWRALGTLGVAFMVLVVVRELRRGGRIDWPGPLAILLAATLVGVGLWMSSTAWLRVLGIDRGDRVHRADFFSAQLGKYLPGGIWQPLGQVGLSNERGIPKLRSSAAVMAHAGLQVAMGVALAFPFSFLTDLPGIARAGAALALLAPSAVYVLIRLLGRSRRFAEVAQAIGGPSSAIVTGTLLLVNLFLQGVAFSVLAGVDWDQTMRVAAAFAVAWTVGFLAVPFPAGLGVREAVLLALVPAQAGTIVAASVVARVVTIATEFALIVLTRVRT